MSSKTVSNLLILTIFFVGAIVGFIACAIVIDEQLAKEGRYDSIELQHQVMMEDNEEFKYCPYCGEKLERY